MPERGEVAEHDRGDQVEADARPAEQDDEDRVDPERHQHVHPPLVAGRHLLQVVDHRGRARPGRSPVAPASGPPGRSPRSRTVADVLQRLEARVGERVGLEDDVDPGDVVQVGRVGRA